MKKILALLSFLLIFTASYSQIYDPVKWSTSVEKISDTDYDLLINATIEDKWHLYSQNVPEDGPIPTSFNFEQTDKFELVGETLEEEGITVNDPVFNMEIKYFENSATFKQRIKVLSKNRAIPDIIRSIAHEMVHHQQNDRGDLEGKPEEGEEGSPWEDEANAKAGTLIRKFGKENPEIYDL